MSSGRANNNDGDNNVQESTDLSSSSEETVANNRQSTSNPVQDPKEAQSDNECRTVSDEHSSEISSNTLNNNNIEEIGQNVPGPVATDATEAMTTTNAALTCLLLPPAPPQQLQQPIEGITNIASNMVRNGAGAASAINNNNNTNNINNNNINLANINNTLNNILNNNSHLSCAGGTSATNWWSEKQQNNGGSGGINGKLATAAATTTANVNNIIINNMNNNNANNQNSQGGSNHLPKAILKFRPNSHPFQMRTLTLIPNVEVKVGRAVARHPVAETNAIFDCKVLSRNHAVLWYSDDKFYIRDMGSSNGTFVNNQRLSQSCVPSEKFEICSGDIVQFGVDVIENGRKETHGCIVATVKLYLPDGRETKASQFTGVSAGNNAVPAEDLYRLHQYIQEAIQREHIVERRLNELQMLIEVAKSNVNQNWQAMVDEDRLLNRIDILESKLRTFQKNCGSEDKIREELRHLQDDKLDYQHASKEALRRVYHERHEALQKLSDVELALRNSEDEGTMLRDRFLKSEADLNDTMTRLTAVQQKHDEMCNKYRELESKVQLLESLNESNMAKSDGGGGGGEETQPVLVPTMEQIASLLREQDVVQNVNERRDNNNKTQEDRNTMTSVPASLMKLFANSDLRYMEGSEDIINSICNAPEEEAATVPMPCYDSEKKQYSKVWYKLTDVAKHIQELERLQQPASKYASQTSLNSVTLLVGNAGGEGQESNIEDDNKSLASSEITVVGDGTPLYCDVVKQIFDQLKEIYADILSEMEPLRAEVDAEPEEKSKLEELENKLNALEKELGERPSMDEYQEKVKEGEDLQLELLSVQLRVTELREQLERNQELNEQLSKELANLKETVATKEEPLQFKETALNLMDVAGGGGEGGDGGGKAKIANISSGADEAKELELDMRWMNNPMVEVEEQLVLYKEDNKQLFESKVDLQRDLDLLQKKYDALVQRSIVQLMIYVCPVLAFLGYFVVWPYL